METVFPVNGVRLGIASAGIKKVGRKDLVIIELAPGTATAAVFTRNDFCAAPVVLARQHLSQAAPRYLMINTGNANAGTGESGLLAASATVRALAERVGCAEEEVLPFSTGVIGEPLPIDKLVAAQAPALADLHEDHWQTAAEGIMTTDTRPKVASVQIPFGDHYFSITGITKGAGMIRPNMATMLSFVATDLAIAPALLKVALSRAVEQSYHRITIDGDTSTNDACTLSATGASSLPPISSESDPLYLHFCDALESLLYRWLRRWFAMVRAQQSFSKSRYTGG